MSGPGIAWQTVENGVQSWASFGSGLPGTSCIWYGQNQGRPGTPFIELKWGAVRRVGQDGIKYDDAPLVLVPIAVTGVIGSILTAPAHGLQPGDGPVQLADVAGILPAPLALLTNYWVVPVDANHLQIASSFQNVWIPTTIPLTTSGSGTITIVSTALTRRAGAELNRRAQGIRKVTLTLQCFGTSGIGGQGADQLLDAVVSAYPLRQPQLVAAGVGVLQLGQVKATDGVISTVVFEPRAMLDITLCLASEVVVPDTYIERVRITPTVDDVQGPVFTVDGAGPVPTGE